ncbi:choline transporter [Serinicoccus sp. CNJ-927]|uniref:BCCT family transporter n=1 Tax=Serinicoccus sp. CNJ-927 TaxID=1904970 RepID=UPI000965787D|nr:BCCT family transporter [Serinicoccus sp. CNJ-927]OLT44069.1 choline transporter [Serinicoccus sp. CNJ-927]
MTTSTESPPTQEEAASTGLAPRVFYPAAAIVVVFVLAAVVFPASMNSALQAANEYIVNTVGWYYVLLSFLFVVFSIWLAISRYGDIKLGKDDDAPDFSYGSWFAMLFSAGMGIGLMFWGVAEPLNHFAGPPPGTAEGSSQADVAITAMSRTFLHWGLHAWAIYIIVGLGVAYAVHRRKLPVSIRFALRPLLGDRADGWIGDVIDVVAIVGTLFGVATSLGFGVAQVSAGLEFVGVVEDSSALLQVLLIAGITVVATASVVSGVDKGIKWLSNINLSLAGLLLIFVLVAGPTLFLLNDMVQSIGYYLQNFFSMSFSTFAYQEEGPEWLGSWTTYYWGWWISWSPFVGIFIARISRGRTVREFITGVLLVPTLLTMAWFVIMGGTALHRQVFGDGSLVGEDGSVSTNEALFQMLDGLPGGPFLAGLAIVMIVIFFVTSSDSGSFVVDMIANGGNPNPPVWSRVMWALLEGAIAAVLIVAGAIAGVEGGGLASLQTMAIITAAPFTLVMIGICISLVKAFVAEDREKERIERKVMARELAIEASEMEGVPDPAPRR